MMRVDLFVAFYPSCYQAFPLPSIVFYYAVSETSYVLTDNAPGHILSSCVFGMLEVKLSLSKHRIPYFDKPYLLVAIIVQLYYIGKNHFHTHN